MKENGNENKKQMKEQNQKSNSGDLEEKWK